LRADLDLLTIGIFLAVFVMLLGIGLAIVVLAVLSGCLGVFDAWVLLISDILAKIGSSKVSVSSLLAETPKGSSKTPLRPFLCVWLK
jgi:hypothetical protein